MVNVEMCQFSIVRTPRHLKTSYLGPCLGLALYFDNSNTNLAGLAHIFPSEYDLVEEMIDSISCRGVKIDSVVAKMAGSTDLIAARKVKNMISTYDVKMIGEDVGKGEFGNIFEREMILRASDGRVVVKRYDVRRYMIGTLVL